VRARSAILAVAAMLTLTGCLSHIPDTGAISYGAEAYAPSSQNFVRTLVSPPTVGANAQVLIREFLAAIVGDQGDYATSRLYLAPESKLAWHPETGVRIYSDRLQTIFTHLPRGSDTYSFSAVQVATIDGQGHYERAPAGATLYENFSVREVNGEWRISSLSDGLALSESDVARAYRQSNIYFLNPSKRNLVPDSVYLPVNLGISTALIRALLAGPTKWLAPAVTSAIPFATSLVAGSVPIEQGVANVDLSLPFVQLSSSDRQAMSAQIVWTLKQLAEVAAVRITLGRVPLIPPGAGEAQSRFAYSSFSPDVLTGDIQPFIVDDRGLFAISDLVSKPTLTQVKSNASANIAQFSAAAISLDGRSIAGITSAGSLVSGPLIGPFDLRVAGTPQANWVAPSWDSDGNLWAVRYAPDQTAVFVITPEGRTVPVLAQAFKNRAIQGFRIARDGSRAAFAIAGGISSRLFVARVIRMNIANGMNPLFRIEAPIELPWTGGTISSINWMDATHLVILTSTTPKSVWRAALDASEVLNLAGIVDPVAISAAPGMPVLVADKSGKISALIGQSWLAIGSGRYPVYPG
jgi:hypothetical protein